MNIMNKIICNTGKKLIREIFLFFRVLFKEIIYEPKYVPAINFDIVLI